MFIRKIVSTALVAVALFSAQSASASSIQFFQKNSEITAAHAQINGKLAVRMTINADGSIQDVRVARSSGNSEIDRQAVLWMQAQTLRPATVNGVNQAFHVVKEIKFSNTDSMQLGMTK
ncbi:MAG: TonB family protein [Neisseria sp.]|uniref:energy transducer TonB family protein n=1 Tax=Neisseria sp. TaxID=192066 RepID=UPI0026DBC600|nr:TonB family protein [Neisseria sp.]MDO4641113.1 TonB family protein [Neisseria sp.]